MCIKYLTYDLSCIIWSFMITPAKRKALLASGTLNPHPEAVRSELFHTDFFDPYDFAQVKYEMLRAHSSSKTRWPRCAANSALAEKVSIRFSRLFKLGFSSFAAQARPQRPGQTERRSPRVRPRAEKGESRDRPGHMRL